MKKILFFTVLILAMFSALSANAEDMPKENSFRYDNGVPIEYEYNESDISLFTVEDKQGIKGIDVSTFQGDIDWEKVKADGVEFAIIRCGFGDDLTQYDDAKWKRNADECTRLGIPFGAYLYSYAASEEEARSEAAHAIRLLAGYNLSYPVYLDLEDKTVGACSNDMIGRIATIFCDTLQDKGYDVGIYANLSWWTTRLTGSAFQNSSWHKWIAQWGSNCTYNGDYTMWQYSSTGQVNGISGNVDMDYFYKDTVDDNTYSNTYKNTGYLANDIVGVAKTQIEYTELDKKGGTRVEDSATPLYTKYGETYGNAFGHWCAYFVLWCGKEAQIPNSIICQSPSCGSCGNFVEWFKSNHRWEDNSYTPKAGDIIFFDWERDGSPNHVGIVQGASGNTVYTIEGNTGGENGYKVMERERNSSIFGYGVPDYDMIKILNGTATKKQTAYLLPSSSSGTVWYTEEKDELQVLCQDGDYYLAKYPFNYTGKFITSYIPADAVKVTGSIPNATDFYSINKTSEVNKSASLYHNSTMDSVIGASGNDCTVRTALSKGDRVTVLFAEGDFYFVKTDAQSGYILKSDVDLEDLPLNTRGELNGDGIADAGDAGMILRYDAGLLNLTTEQITRGDINGDGVADAGDAGIILRKDAGLLK